MTEFRLARRQGLVVGGVIILAILLVDALCVYLIQTRPITLLTFALNIWLVLSVGAIGLMGYWLWGLYRAYYAMDRNQLVINWGQTRQVVPMASIERVVDGADAEGPAQLRAFHWPGYYMGPGRLPHLGLTLFYASRTLRRQVLIVTPAVTYALSPADKEGFLEALEVRQRMGATQAAEQVSQVPSWLHWDVWRDRAALGLVAGALVLNLILFAYLAIRHAWLPLEIPLHFDAAGGVDRAGTSAEIFFLPFIGLGVWAVNGLLGGLLYLRWRELVGAYLLWGSAALMQLLLWLATINLLTAPYVHP